jgi:hypothetical protein
MFIFISQALYADIVAHRETLDKLEEKSEQVKDTNPRGLVSDLKARYHTLSAASKVRG